MRECWVDSFENPNIVTKRYVGECVPLVESFEVDFGSDATTATTHYRCQRCSNTWSETGPFEIGEVTNVSWVVT